MKNIEKEPGLNMYGRWDVTVRDEGKDEKRILQMKCPSLDTANALNSVTGKEASVTEESDTWGS